MHFLSLERHLEPFCRLQGDILGTFCRFGQFKSITPHKQRAVEDTWYRERVTGFRT